MLTIPAEFAYGALGAALLAVWLVLYFANPAGRAAQIRMSLLFLLFIPFELLYLTDYWRPPKHLMVPMFGGYLGIEDVLFAFTFGGIVASIVAFFDRSYAPAGWITVLVAAVATFGLTILIWRVGTNSLVAASSAALAVVAFFLLADRSVARRAAIGGLCAAVVMVAVYATGFVVSSNTEVVLQSIWLLYDTPLGARVAGVPVTEVLWAFSFGALIAVL
jgi:hypothetical protein